jgi:hypothetical protein
VHAAENSREDATERQASRRVTALMCRAYVRSGTHVAHVLVQPISPSSGTNHQIPSCWTKWRTTVVPSSNLDNELSAGHNEVQRQRSFATLRMTRLQLNDQLFGGLV